MESSQGADSCLATPSPCKNILWTVGTSTIGSARSLLQNICPLSNLRATSDISQCLSLGKVVTWLRGHSCGKMATPLDRHREERRWRIVDGETRANAILRITHDCLSNTEINEDVADRN